MGLCKQMKWWNILETLPLPQLSEVDRVHKIHHEIRPEMMNVLQTRPCYACNGKIRKFFVLSDTRNKKNLHFQQSF